MTINEIRDTIAAAGNKRGAILAALEQGFTLTVKSANYVGRTNDARKRISELRRAGHTINSRYVTNEVGERFKQYWLVKPKANDNGPAN